MAEAFVLDSNDSGNKVKWVDVRVATGAIAARHRSPRMTAAITLPKGHGLHGSCGTQANGAGRPLIDRRAGGYASPQSE